MASATLSPAKLKKVLAAWRATGKPRWRATTPTRRWPTGTRTRCAPRCCAIWRRRSGSTPSCGHGRIKELGGPSRSTRAAPAARPTRWPTAPAASAWPCAAWRSRRAAHIASYGEQLKALGDEGSIAILDHVIEDEKDHYRELGSLLRGHYTAPAGAHKIDAQAVLE